MTSRHHRILLSLLFLALVPFTSPAQSQSVGELRPAGSYPEGLSWVSHVRELPDGRVIVADPMAGVILRIDMAAGVADTLGREGGGPGEYRQPDRVLPMAGDSTLLVDIGNSRFSVLAPNGSIGRTIPMALEDSREGRGLMMVFPRFSDSLGSVYFQPDPLLAPGALTGDSAQVTRVSLTGGGARSMAMVKTPSLAQRSSRQGGGVATMIRPLPLSPEDDWAVGLDGAVAVVRSSDYHVEWLRPDGTRVMGRPVPYRPVRIRRAEQEQWIEEYSQGNLNVNRNNNNGEVTVTLARGIYSPRGLEPGQFSWPEVMPPFRAGHTWVSPRGEVWVERSVPAGSDTTVDVFDGQGEHMGSLTLPGGRHVVGFGAGTVYLAHSDEFGLFWLERYRID